MNDDITFYLNRRGTRKATFRGYDYCKDREYKEKMYWKCTNRLCGGRIITFEYIVVKETEHSLHGPDYHEVKKNLSMARAIPELATRSRVTETDSSFYQHPVRSKYHNDIVLIKSEQDELMDVTNVGKHLGTQPVNNYSKAMHVDPANNKCFDELQELHHSVLKHTKEVISTDVENGTKPSVFCYDGSENDLFYLNQNNHGENVPISHECGEQNAGVCYMSEQCSSERYSLMEHSAGLNLCSNTDNIQELHQADLHIRLCMAMFKCRENADINLEISTPDFSDKHGKFYHQTQSRNTGLADEEIKFLHDLLKYLDGLPN